jgi:hypothetical protein
MIIIVEGMWPPDKATDLGKAFLEAPPIPDYVTMQGPYICTALEKGTRAITIFEFDSAKIDDVLNALTLRYVAYARIPGFKYEIRVWGKAQEQLELIGLK